MTVKDGGTVAEGGSETETDTTSDDTQTIDGTPPQEPEDADEGDDTSTDDDDAQGSDLDDDVRIDYSSLDAETRKKVNRILTRTQQRHAKARDEDREGQAIAKALKEDPQGFIRLIGQQLGLDIKEAPKTQAEVDTAYQVAVKQLGKEGADALLPVLEAFSNSIVTSKMTPVMQELQSLRATAAQASADADVKLFEARNPDWKKYEAAMLDVGKRIRPAEGSSTQDYLQILYNEATKGRKSAATAKKVAARVVKASEGATDVSTASVPAGKVSHTRPEGKITAKQAFEAAKAGVRWEP